MDCNWHTFRLERKNDCCWDLRRSNLSSLWAKIKVRPKECIYVLRLYETIASLLCLETDSNDTRNSYVRHEISNRNETSWRQSQRMQNFISSTSNIRWRSKAAKRWTLSSKLAHLVHQRWSWLWLTLKRL